MYVTLLYIDGEDGSNDKRVIVTALNLLRGRDGLRNATRTWYVA
jgi:hypothetical protein